MLRALAELILCVLVYSICRLTGYEPNTMELALLVIVVDMSFQIHLKERGA